MRLRSRNVNCTNLLLNLVTVLLEITTRCTLAHYQADSLPDISSPYLPLYEEDAQLRPVHPYHGYLTELEVPDGQQSFRNEAELIQNEVKRLRLINPDAERMSMSESGLIGKNISFEAYERGQRTLPLGNWNGGSDYDDYTFREFVPISSGMEDENGNLKLRVKMNLGNHEMPPLEYRLPRHWLSRQLYRGRNSRNHRKVRPGNTHARRWTGVKRRGYPSTRRKSTKGAAFRESSKRREPYPPRRKSAPPRRRPTPASKGPPLAGRKRSPTRRIYGSWRKWSGCMGVCGEGMRERTRKCLVSSVNCDGEMLRERAACRLREKCPKGMKQPKMGPWGAWSPCSATCGKSYRVRVRSCSIPSRCDRELLRQRRLCSVPSCRRSKVQRNNRKPRRRGGIRKSSSRDTLAQGRNRATSRRKGSRSLSAHGASFIPRRSLARRRDPSRGCQKGYFTHKLPKKSFTCPLSAKAANAKWTSRTPFVFPLADANSEPNDKVHLEIRFGRPRTVTGWRIAGSVRRGIEGAVSTYMVKVFGPSLNAWQFLAGPDHIPRVFLAAPRRRKNGQRRVFVEKLTRFVPHVSMIRFYPLQWSGKPYFKVDVEACTSAIPVTKRRKPSPGRRRVHIVRARRKNKKPGNPVKHLRPNECSQIPSKEIMFYEIDYDKKVENLKHLPDLRGDGYVNLRLLSTIKTSQNHNNHVSLEVDLGRKRKVEQLLFKGALREGLPAMLRAFYLQFLDPQDNEWRWLSHLGKPTPFIITTIPVLNREQVQTVFSVRFSHSLSTAKLRIYPELWQKLPLIKMGVIACGP